MATSEHVHCGPCNTTSLAVPDATVLAAVHDHNMHGGRKTAEKTIQVEQAWAECEARRTATTDRKAA